MNMPSESRAESRAERVLVWDLPVRIFHWTLVASFAGAWLTAESESWRLVHVTLGYTVAALVAFRILWGFAGTRYARFSEFVKGPSSVVAYVKSMLAGKPRHFVGHNPAGAIAIVALLVLAALVSLTGWAMYEDIGGKALEELHEGLASTMLGVAIVHVAGVVIGSFMHRENLVRAMFTGRKEGTSAEAIRSPRWGTALLLIALVTGVWWFQSTQTVIDGPAKTAHHNSATDDDD
jgi:cytochrome b